MDELRIKQIALLCAIIGLVILAYASFFMSGVVEISDITIEDVGRRMKVCGEISFIRENNGHVFFVLNDGENELNGVIFNTTALKMNESGSSPYNLNIGDFICLPGKIDEYPKNSGEIEIIYEGGVIERTI